MLYAGGLTDGAELADVIGLGDGIRDALFTAEELRGGFARLVAAGFVRAEAGRYFVVGEARGLAKKEGLSLAEHGGGDRCFSRRLELPRQRSRRGGSRSHRREDRRRHPHLPRATAGREGRCELSRLRIRQTHSGRSCCSPRARAWRRTPPSRRPPTNAPAPRSRRSSTRFLSPEQNPTRAAHERFWADDLVYTSSAGKVTNKAEILKLVRRGAERGAAAKAGENRSRSTPPRTSSCAPDGEVAALTFRLVARAADGSMQHYRNSGTFLFRDGKWQAITWQATKVPVLAPLPPEAK